MTANPSQQPATPDELEARLAHLGLPARGVTDRRATLPAPLRAFHRRLLGAFLTQAGPPGPAVVARLAAQLGSTRGRRLRPWPPPTWSTPTRRPAW